MNRLNVALHALNRFGHSVQLRLGAVGVLGVGLLLAAGIALVFAMLANREVQLRLGAVGVLGVGLLLAAGIALVFAMLANRETEWLSARTEQARARVAQTATLHTEDPSPAEQLARFQQWFPLADQSTSDLRVIFAAAQSAHVKLARGEYSLRPIEGSGGLQRFVVILSVKEHYAPVKTFVAEILNKLPHAGLDELRVERPGSAANQLDSRAHFTLFHRERTA